MELYELHIIGPLNLLARTLGSPTEESLAIVEAIDNSLSIIRNAKPGTGPLCICLDCTTEFTAHNTPLRFCLLMPIDLTHAKTCVASGICRSCISLPDLDARLRESYEKGLKNQIQILDGYHNA